MSFEDHRQGGEALPRGPTSQPYRGPARTRRSDGQREVWIEGQGYVPENDLRRLPQQEREMVETARNRARDLNSALPDFRRFIELNETNPTGALSHVVGSWTAQPQWLNDPDIDEMRAITDRWTPRQRQGLPGAASDRDVAMFRGGIPGITRGGNGNRRVLEAIERQAKEETAYADFLDWWWPQRGNLTGADEAWRGYRQADPEMRGEWRTHFQRQTQGAQTPPPRPAGVPQEAQWDAQRRRWVME